MHFLSAAFTHQTTKIVRTCKHINPYLTYQYFSSKNFAFDYIILKATVDESIVIQVGYDFCVKTGTLSSS